MMKPLLTGFMKTALEDFRSFVEDSDAQPDPNLRPVQAHAHVA